MEHHRHQPLERRIHRVERKEGLGERRAALRRRRVERLEQRRIERAQGLHQARVDLGLGQRALGCREEWLAEVEVVARELEVEERRLPLLVLRRRRQHVVGEARGLGQGDVDHHQRVEARERLAHLRAVGERVRRVAALDDHRAVARRVIGEDLVGDHVARHQSADDPRAHHRARPGARRGAEELAERRERVHRARLRVVAGERPQELLDPAHQGRVAVHLHAEVLGDRDALRGGEASRHQPHDVLGDPRDRGVARHRDRPEARQHLLRSAGVLADPGVVHEIFLHQHPHHRRHQPRVGAGLHLQVDVGELRGLGAARVDHDQGARGVLGDLAERVAGPRQPVGVPRILAEEERDLGVLEVGARAGAEHEAVHPEVPGLLLGQGARAIAGSERREGGAGVRAAEVIPLPAAAVIEDRLAAVGVTDLREARGDLADRRVPVDLLEACRQHAGAAGA
jgi:hypothetical protein